MLRPVYDATDGVDGRVSIEVDPRLAHETDKTIAEARALWWMVDRPNMFIKIPATLEGLPAITQCLSEGISVNVTLIFSLRALRPGHRRLHGGLEAASGRDVASIASVASFFVSRVDTEVDERLDKIGTPEADALRGKAALANARLAYELFEQRSATPRWEALAARGARPQRPLWASTSVKDPSFADTMYVTNWPHRAPSTRCPRRPSTPRPITPSCMATRSSGTYDESRRVFEQLEALGVHYDDVVQVLEEQGVEKFAASWNELLESISTRDGRWRQHHMRPNPLRDPRDRRIPRLAGPCVLVLFGVTGDLASKKLLPAIYDLANRGLLPPGFSLVGFARRDWADADFARITHDAVKAHARTPFREEVWQQLAEGIRFVPGEFADDEAFDNLARTVAAAGSPNAGTGGNYAFYLSVPPERVPGRGRSS